MDPFPRGNWVPKLIVGMQTQFTAYPEVNAVLDALLPKVQVILGDEFVGLYLHGSLANGGFNPQTSDIDFLVVTGEQLPTGSFSALREMHTLLRSAGPMWARKLEGAYIPREGLRRHDHVRCLFPWLGTDGHFALEILGSDWIIQRWILREKGIVIAGLPLKPMIDPIGADDLREAVRRSLREWWSPPLPFPERFQRAEYQAYAVLTMCRALYMLEYACIASKPRAAGWALGTLGEPWSALIEEALTWRPGLEFKQLEEVISFIRFALEKWKLPASRNGIQSSRPTLGGSNA